MLFLSLKLAGEVFAVETLRVKEVMPLTRITRVPRAKPEVCGVVNLRGGIIAVFDLRVLLGMKKTELTAQSNIVVLEYPHEGEVLVQALLVDGVREVLELDESHLSSPPKVRSNSSKHLQHMARSDHGFILILNVASLFGIERGNGSTVAGPVVDWEGGGIAEVAVTPGRSECCVSPIEESPSGDIVVSDEVVAVSENVMVVEVVDASESVVVEGISEAPESLVVEEAVDILKNVKIEVVDTSTNIVVEGITEIVGKTGATGVDEVSDLDVLSENVGVSEIGQEPGKEDGSGEVVTETEEPMDSQNIEAIDVKTKHKSKKSKAASSGSSGVGEKGLGDQTRLLVSGALAAIAEALEKDDTPKIMEEKQTQGTGDLSTTEVISPPESTTIEMQLEQAVAETLSQAQGAKALPPVTGVGIVQEDTVLDVCDTLTPDPRLEEQLQARAKSRSQNKSNGKMNKSGKKGKGRSRDA